MSTTTSPRAFISSHLSSPIPLRQASFANLARFFGIGGSFAETKVDEHESEHEKECDGEVEAEETDEESLMWDAQVGHRFTLSGDRSDKTSAHIPGGSHCSSTLPCYQTIHRRCSTSPSMGCSMFSARKPLDKGYRFHLSRYSSRSKRNTPRRIVAQKKGAREIHIPVSVSCYFPSCIATVPTDPVLFYAHVLQLGTKFCQARPIRIAVIR